MKTKVIIITTFGYLAIVFSIVGILLSVSSGKAEDVKEVAPYEFAKIPVPFHAIDVKVYKMVHQGCEIYVTTNSAMGQEAASVAIATGRGCK